MIKRIWHSIPSFLKNRYAVTLFVFALWMLLFDQNDIISQFKLKSQLNELKKEQTYYREQIKITQAELENLLNDNDKLEKFAREKYLMKKPDEEIFVIIRED